MTKNVFVIIIIITYNLCHHDHPSIQALLLLLYQSTETFVFLTALFIDVVIINVTNVCYETLLVLCV